MRTTSVGVFDRDNTRRVNTYRMLSFCHFGGNVIDSNLEADVDNHRTSDRNGFVRSDSRFAEY